MRVAAAASAAASQPPAAAAPAPSGSAPVITGFEGCGGVFRDPQVWQTAFVCGVKEQL